MKKKIFSILMFYLCFIGIGTTVCAAEMEVSTTKQTGNKVKVTWNAIDGATKYQVMVSEGNKNNYKKKATIAAVENVTNTGKIGDGRIDSASGTEQTVMDKVISGISKQKTYYFKVQAMDDGGKLIDQNTTNFYNGNIVSTTKQQYSYADMQKDIRQLRSKYSDYVHVNVIGKTADNRSIYDVMLGNPDAKKCIVVQASIHAREYMTSQLVMEQVEYYLDHYDQKYKKKTYRDIFDKVCVHVVAMSNPDGVTISQKGFSGIRSASLRKKLKKMYGARYTTIWKANARGVDLNNQFDNNFRYIKKYKQGAYAGYGGKKPVSEAESKALVKLVNEVKPKAVVNYHAMGNVIYCNYGGPKKVQEKVYKLAGEIRSLTGYYYMGLDTAPGFANWLVCKKGIPSCTIEVGVSTAPVPISQFRTIWRQNKDVVAAAARLYY